MHYDLYSDFDIEKHKQTYVNYLEVIITEDGVVHYAVPSHQEYLIHLLMSMRNQTRDELFASCPDDFYFDVITWLCKETKAIAVWNSYVQWYTMNANQINTLKELSSAGIYHGDVPNDINDTLGMSASVY